MYNKKRKIIIENRDIVKICVPLQFDPVQQST